MGELETKARQTYEICAFSPYHKKMAKGEAVLTLSKELNWVEDLRIISNLYFCPYCGESLQERLTEEEMASLASEELDKYREEKRIKAELIEKIEQKIEELVDESGEERGVRGTNVNTQVIKDILNELKDENT